ncbi:MAG: hypothetical protein GXO26_04740 [Crenarchaeota archaeon]|nr:hypothetical protein [Thermoproteota archaeon]
MTVTERELREIFEITFRLDKEISQHQIPGIIVNNIEVVYKKGLKAFAVEPTLILEVDLRNNYGGRVIGIIISHVYVSFNKEQRIIQGQDVYLTSIPRLLLVDSQRECKIGIPILLTQTSCMYISEKLPEFPDGKPTFKFVFEGLIIQSGSTQPQQGILNKGIQVKQLPAEDWRRFISDFYEDIAFIPVKKETYNQLIKLMREDGYLHIDQVIRKLLEVYERSRREGKL